MPDEVRQKTSACGTYVSGKSVCHSVFKASVFKSDKKELKFMPHPVNGIDHVFILANDLENSADRFRQFGFTLSPRGLHSKEQGTANYTIMFRHDYVELLGIVEETPANREKKHDLKHFGEGLYAIAGRIDHAAEARNNLLELGFEVGDIQKFSRPLELSDGSKGIAAFETIAFNRRHVPKGLLFMCQHKTRNMVWQPQLLTHENGAIGLSSITVLSATPEQTAKQYARLFKEGATEDKSDHVKVITGRDSAFILVMTADNFAKRFDNFDVSKTPRNAYAALAIYVANINTTRAVLTKNNIAHSQTSQHHIALAPEIASGTVLEFVELDK